MQNSFIWWFLHVAISLMPSFIDSYIGLSMKTFIYWFTLWFIHTYMHWFMLRVNDFYIEWLICLSFKYFNNQIVEHILILVLWMSLMNYGTNTSKCNMRSTFVLRWSFIIRWCANICLTVILTVLPMESSLTSRLSMPSFSRWLTSVSADSC